MMKTKPIGLYVHIPFCKKKCAYCDFCSFAELSDTVREQYISRLVSEIMEYKREEKIAVDTVFFGGGTPSLLTPDEFFRIHSAIEKSFEILPETEFTVEVNPKTLTEEILKAFISRGVNRISIGMQTIHENERKILGRIHDFEDFLGTFKLVREHGISNINVDIMYAIPEQTKESLAQTLDAVCALKPEHISAYGLIVEEGTPFFELRDSGVFHDADTEYEMYLYLSDYLAKRGYTHYEISNYAIDGHSSRHNLKYWHNEEYIGVGISAYSNFLSKRYGNTRVMSEYLVENYKEYISSEQTDCTAHAYEYAMLGLRLKEGISLSEYERLSGINLLSAKKEKISEYISLGLMTHQNDRIALTETGFYVSNMILAELL